MQTIPPPRSDGLTASTRVPLYWAKYGPKGERPLIVLHGGPAASHEYLLPQMLALAEHRELVFYDQRGGGRSRTDDPSPITWQTHVEDLAAIVTEMSTTPLEIVGYSWGGLLAALYLIQAHRDRRLPMPARLVLLDPAPINRRYREQFNESLTAASEPLTSRRCETSWPSPVFENETPRHTASACSS